MRRRLGLSVLASACIVIAACGTDSTKQRTEAAGWSDAPTDLADLIITEVPSGFVLERDIPGETGPFDIEAAVAELDDAASERTALQDSDFLAGHTRTWYYEVTETKFTEMVVTLWAHATHGGATKYLDHLVGASGADCVAGFIPNARCDFSFSDREPHPADGGGGGGAVTFARGRYVAAVAMRGHVASPATLSSLAQQQYDRLPPR